MKAILDTSVVLATDVGELEGELAISAATIAELHVGVLVTANPDIRAERLRRLSLLQRSFDALPVDDTVAASYGVLAAAVVAAGRQPRARVMDLLIAATAHAYGARLYTRNAVDLVGLEQLLDVATVQPGAVYRRVMAPNDTPRVRLTPVPDDGVLVVRGDELDRGVLIDDASRFHERFPAWGRFGISAFYAASEDEVDALCQARLVRFADVAVFHRTDLERRGVEIVPTFRTPHVTLCHRSLDGLVARLINCEHIVRTNPYHVPEEGGG